MQSTLTQASEREFGRIRSGEMTPAMAAVYLQDERIPLRRFDDTLREMYPYPDLSIRLINAFREGEQSLPSVHRKVANWLAGASRPQSREDLFRMAFALDLSEQQAGALLGMCTEFGIHYREGREVVYAWCLRRGMGYQEARDLFDSLPPVPKGGGLPPGEDPYTITHRLQDQFALAHTEEELRRCYEENLGRFGAFHLRAYRYFYHYMDALIHPVSPWDDTPEEAYSLDTVMEKYLTLGMPSGKSRAGYTLTQKLIKRGWPNTTALKNILARRSDVPRKLLLLLYIITGNAGNDYSELDEDYLTTAERLDRHWWTINAMLLDCGMPPLDPRSASDWLFCYALTAPDDESMADRLEQVIDKLYENVR